MKIEHIHYKKYGKTFSQAVEKFEEKHSEDCKALCLYKRGSVIYKILPKKIDLPMANEPWRSFDNFEDAIEYYEDGHNCLY